MADAKKCDRCGKLFEPYLKLDGFKNPKEFKMYCKSYGLDPEDYDRRFTYDGKDYIIIGIRPSKRKYRFTR